MKRMVSIFIFLTVMAAAWASHARAGGVKMVFWYPGEAGSTAEAQPVLDTFFEYLSKEITPDTVTGSYFNTVNGGLDYISKQKPVVGIISYSAWAQNRARLSGARVVLATLPLPQGKDTVKYSIVGTEKELPSGATIYTSEPLKMAFVKQHLFPNLPGDVKLEQTDRIFVKIKSIAAGETKGFAILTPMEAASLKKLKSSWSKSLKNVATSKPVPSARVVVFSNGMKEGDKVARALLSTNKDPAASEILEELRLKGFRKIN